jgi:hypothetical protein
MGIGVWGTITISMMFELSILSRAFSKDLFARVSAGRGTFGLLRERSDGSDNEDEESIQ